MQENDDKPDDGQSENDEANRDQQQFKKMKRPIHSAKRSKTPERLRGMHRRRRKRMAW